MPVPWSGCNFLLRRRLDRLFLDLPDALIRASNGTSHLPPRSLRSFVGEPGAFMQAGEFFRDELKTMRLINSGCRILDIGCGCGRLALALAADPDIRNSGTRYVGVDVDRACIGWCREHIASRDPRFEFHHADCRNPSYNPNGKIPAETYRFPFPDRSFDLILLTSVLTHLTESGLRHYLNETARLLAPLGVVYATVFLYRSPEEISKAGGRHAIAFKEVRDTCAYRRSDRPADAVAYHEPFLREVLRETGLSIIEPVSYGSQDLLLLTKRPDRPVEFALGHGWHELEKDSWRWTGKCFSVRLTSGEPAVRNLEFHFDIPPAMLHALGSISLRATANGSPLEETRFAASGEQVYRATLAGTAGAALDLEFRVDKGYLPNSLDTRELGLQVPFFAACRGGHRELYPFRLA